MAIKTINWANLNKLTEADVRYTEASWTLLPDTVARERLSLSIRKMLMKHLGEKAFYYLDGVTTAIASGHVSNLQENDIIVSIGTNAGAGKALLQIDRNLAFLVIDRLLGGGAEPVVESRKLSETEEGVLQYFIMQVLSCVWQVFGAKETVHFRFERFLKNPSEVVTAVPAKDTLVIFSYKVGVGEYAGFVRLAVSASMLEKRRQLSSHAATDEEIAKFYEDLSRFDYVRTSVWAEAGRAGISAREIAMMEEGDVILFDECAVALTDKGVTGEVDLKVGRGEEGALRASVVTDGRNLKCTIQG
jgi:flagellar motor switch protein FliM